MRVRYNVNFAFAIVFLCGVVQEEEEPCSFIFDQSEKKADLDYQILGTSAAFSTLKLSVAWLDVPSSASPSPSSPSPFSGYESDFRDSSSVIVLSSSRKGTESPGSAKKRKKRDGAERKKKVKTVDDVAVFVGIDGTATV